MVRTSSDGQVYKSSDWEILDRKEISDCTAMVIGGGENTRVLHRLWSDRPKGFGEWVSINIFSAEGTGSVCRSDVLMCLQRVRATLKTPSCTTT